MTLSLNFLFRYTPLTRDRAQTKGNVSFDRSEGERVITQLVTGCTLVFTLSVIIVLSYSAQPLALKHWPKFLGKFAATARTHSNSEPPPQFHYEKRYFQQRLDHFSFSELPTFPQRYLISTEHWVGPHRLGPIFFYCGNEGDIEWFAQNTGFVWEIAPRFGAMVVFPEVSPSQLTYARSNL